jgi:hypothetical protein
MGLMGSTGTWITGSILIMGITVLCRSGVCSRSTTSRAMRLGMGRGTLAMRHTMPTTNITRALPGMVRREVAVMVAAASMVGTGKLKVRQEPVGNGGLFFV